MSHSELATSYAALILADDDVDITVSRRYWKCNDLAVGSTDISFTARQTANPHQSRQRRRCGGNMDNSLR